jgi:hypothetical protein
MARILWDFLQFAWSVISRWQAYVTGSLFTAIAFVYEHLTKNMISPDVVLWGIGGFFVVGAFMAWREQYKKVQDLTGSTEIEVIDDLIVEWEELEELYSGDSIIAPDKLEVLIRNTRAQLRAHCRGYVNSFNDAIKNPHHHSQLFPKKARTIIELGEWMKDESRFSSWKTAAACLAQLREIRKRIASRLPL